MSKITKPGVRFGVKMTSPSGTYRKDMVTGHWTTYAVRDMTRKEAEEVLAYELAKRTVSTYVIIDLDEEAQVREVRSVAAKAVRDMAGYDAIPYDERKLADGLGAAIRKTAMAAADRAEMLARS